ncbi:LytR/AlgR family response regulator transcription factor [Pedobacter sp. UC225_65]|uniref:LytR/AlgR family response regulator transcription factor n=1 Tax=Pedobacter sp. UC225_65 TaxID=3350173 RepID=UPI00366A6552
MSSITCIIIDDEPLGQELIEKYILRMPSLKLLAKCDDAIVAIEKIADLKPQLIFLDVNMPEMSGLELVKTFGAEQPMVILTTAHANYAADGYELDILDFLLKPITFERFVKAINKAKEKVDYERIKQQPNRNEPAQQKRQVVFKENKKFVNVLVEEINYIEGMKDYLKVHTQNTTIVTHMTIKRIEELLPTDEFLRVNRSFIVRKLAVGTITGNTVVMNNGEQIPIGTNYRDMVKNLIENGTL